VGDTAALAYCDLRCGRAYIDQLDRALATNSRDEQKDRTVGLENGQGQNHPGTNDEYAQTDEGGSCFFSFTGLRGVAEANAADANKPA